MDLEKNFNAAVLAHAIAAADQIGLLDQLAEDRHLSAEELKKAYGQSLLGIEYLLDLLARAEVISIDPIDGRLAPGPRFDEAIDYKGFFTWLFAGSISVLTAAPDLLRSGSAVSPVERNDTLISRASADFGRRHLDPILLALPEWDRAGAVADLGCGDGSRLIQLAQGKGLRGIGIDTSQAAIELAQHRARDAGLDHRRVQFFKGDARALSDQHHLLADIDTLHAALMGHDLWPRENCVKTLRNWKLWFPHANTLILCETVRALEHRDTPRIPTLGYEYLHALMGQYIPTEPEWYEVFAEAGWTVMRSLRITIPAHTVIFIASRDPATGPLGKGG